MSSLALADAATSFPDSGRLKQFFAELVSFAYGAGWQQALDESLEDETVATVSLVNRTDRSMPAEALSLQLERHDISAS